ncbi:MAG TPA: thiamine pyrophosphate-dependent enzyme [Chitinophagales bacterium]|nr:thiamine pyrophosphate-dependent enzyme [Chitinophagales bacterium]
MTPQTLQRLQSLALRVREHILRLSTDGGCFTGASLSCTDLIVYLYAEFLNIHKNNLKDPGRDYLFLSKGHDVPALYGTLAELGFIEKERLKNHLKSSDHIYWHPSVSIPGIEFHSGSLGHLPAVAAGVAVDCKLRNTNNRVIVITGDGELNEGSVWEAVMIAAAQNLNNLTFVVDRNEFQANVETEKLVPLESLEEKFRAFHWEVRRVNGHDFRQLEAAFTALPFHPEKPSVIIADTVRGKGVPSIEKRADRWFCNFKKEEVEDLIKELHGAAKTELKSETLVVR